MSVQRILILLLAALLAACGKPQPIVIGFIAGLSNRTTDTGEAARNALTLAIEERNAAGGIGGRPLRLLVGDDGQDAATAHQAMQALIRARPAVIVGPYTSAMADVILPLADAAGVVVLSPVITAMHFVGKDDMLIRLNRSTRDNAADYARELAERGLHRLAVAYDVRNRAFSESWLTELRSQFPAYGGEVIAAVEFESAADTMFSEVAARLLETEPDGLLFIANAVDVARLAQQTRKLSPNMPLAAAEWAASEQLVELGGQAVNGLLIAQSHDRTDEAPRFTTFRDAYRARFQRDPGYSAIASYDAGIVLFQALERRKSGQSVKDAVLRHGPYPGLQHLIEIDAFGDSTRPIHFAEIRDGQFVLVR